MEVLGSSSKDQVEKSQEKVALPEDPLFAHGHVAYAIYALALGATISIWLIALRAPLWIDETGQYWQIYAGFSQIWPRHFMTLSSPEHAYILWLSTKLIGTSEAALRIPSTLAMLGAVYVLYLAARELFERDIAIIAAILFSLHPVVAFEAIDARPYAFGALVVNTSILVLLRLRHNDSEWLAALFGIAAACTVWFQYLFIVMLPALVLCFFVVKNCDRKTLWRQFGIAVAAFALAFLPVIPIMLFLFRTSKTHIVEPAPALLDLVRFLAPGSLFVGVCITGCVAFLLRAARLQRYSLSRFEPSHLLICASLALIPSLLLYGVSVGTSVHPFLPPRHCLDAIPGIALCWAFVLSRFRSRILRLLFCLIFVTVTACTQFSSPLAKLHNPSWKDALQYAEKNASTDNAPVMICSEFPESDFVPMPLDSPKSSKLFSPLSYYNVSVPVVPMPRELNGEAIRVGSSFLQEAAQKHERFLALARRSSDKTLDWLTKNGAATHSVHQLGEHDGVVVLEFVPRQSVALK
jgi:4-amino-4-deoxy-L-arabinose transferase-like glycosyltransferase